MKCLRCGNTDPSYFYKGSKGYYCRKCVRFSRVLLEEELSVFDYEIGKDVEEYRFSYQLTKEQETASRMCVEALKEKDVLLHCVCGAGKTEISVQSIAHYLSQGLRVAYAISRKEVVIELADRFQKIFPKAKVAAVYGGHHETLTGDLIVCTCHQLYRYYQTFDLLILDEVDAFPVKGDEMLINIALSSCKGRVIFSTATVDEDLKKILYQRKVKEVEVFVRPSHKPLSIPKLICLPETLSFFLLFRMMSSMANRCIIFVSSKKKCRRLYRLLSKFYSCTYVYSDLAKRKENIEAFRKGRFRFLISTSVMERGITIPDVSVIILHYGKTFDEASLIQMLGRVGRGVGNTEGSSALFCDRKRKEVRDTINYLRLANSHL